MWAFEDRFNGTLIYLIDKNGQPTYTFEQPQLWNGKNKAVTQILAQVNLWLSLQTIGQTFWSVIDL